MHLVVDLHVDLITVPAPMGNATHSADPLTTYVTCEYRAEPVSPKAYRLVAKIDTTLKQQIFNIPCSPSAPMAQI